jgi:hypothetical protein
MRPLSLGNLTEPAAAAIAIIPDDATDIPVTRGIYVGVQGDVKVTMASGTIVIFVALAAGIIHPLQVKRVWTEATTAQDIVGVL